MAPKKRLPATTPPPRVVGPPGEPVGAFLATLEQAKRSGLAIEPYDIMPGLVLQPPTEARSKALASASAANLLAQTAAVKLVQNPEDPPAPPRPLPNQIAAELDALANNIKGMMSAGDVPDGLIEQMIVAVRNVGATVAEVPPPDIAEYDEYLRQFERYTELRNGFPARQQRELKACQEMAEEAEEAYTEALIGADDNQRVQEFFAERPDWQREAFVDAVTRRFLRLPDDGRCLACGHADPKERSSALTSATGSNTTGMKSPPTSPSTSEEPTLTTGGAEPDLGSSSPTSSTG
jgi:hypothetical protein